MNTQPLLLPQQHHLGRVRAARFLLALLLAVAATLAAAARNAGAQEGEKIIALPEATEGVKYSVPLVPTIKDDAGNDRAVYIPNVVKGVKAPPGLTISEALPPGLEVKPTGKLEGFPTAPRAEPYLFRVHLDGPNGFSRTLLLSLEVRQFLPTGARVIATPTPEQRAEATPVPTPFITTTTEEKETIALTEKYPGPAPTEPFDPKDYKNVPVLRDVIGKTIGTSTNHFEVGDYCIFNLIKWRPLVEGKTDPQREILSLFKAEYLDEKNVKWVEQQDATDENIFSKRIYGSKRVAVLLVNLNTPLTWDVAYTASINQKIPTPVQNAFDLARNAILPGGGGPDKAKTTKDIWGARLMLVKYESSELVVNLNAVTAGPDGKSVEQSKSHTSTFINEKRYRWDVSVGLPVQSVRQLQYKSDGNRVFAEAKEKQSVYGFLNFYPFKAVDLKSDKEPLFPPHFVFGVPLASKPLQRPFVGIGSGLFKMPIKFNIFAGIVFIRERVPRTLGEGSAATTGQLEADLHTRWVRKGMFGINVPISQIKDAIKK